ncbi:two-component system sensor histidine kinase CreC [Geothrix edaphica]|uniref:histidine kinase n=1 Tax=Geothrix edaphica TaxID=2927976 RepID=A0ABQ5PSU3_9BACT|nr:two-component system sensor histidine kinase CreC [Geothrix edaphica]GLH65641.1 two-component sensor histidine kinase [Geothrix edaphica]
MRLGVRVLLAFFLIVALAAYLLLSTFLQEVKPGVKQGMEVALVDTANLLAELAAPELRAGTLAEGRFAEAVGAYRERNPQARIFGVAKRRSEFRVYVTDERGRVVFDSDGTPPGTDYSRWNDVQRTLQGAYGARTTRTDPADETTSTMHVAAPVLWEGRLIGTLTVAAPSASVIPYAQASRRKVMRAGLILLGACLLVGAGISWSLTRAIGRLRVYAREVAEGRRATMPPVGGGELADLGAALETMRSKLEDRAYVERYLATLTHEMKSPLAAIRGAAELLDEDMPEADRRRFAAHIREQEARLRQLLDRMLDQAAIEQRQTLQDPQLLDLGSLARRVAESKAVGLARRGLELRIDLPEVRLRGEAFLLEQAVSNLLDNAMAFSPEGGTIRLEGRMEDGRCRLSVRDEGPGVPAFALPRVFEPFYSVAAPSGRKGTGLGLSFVKEVATLHGGAAGLENHPGGGAEAWLSLPLA